MKTIKSMLVLVGSAVLLAGCATYDKRDSGSMGNDREVGTAADESNTPAPAPMPRSGYNGSVSSSNPLGLSNHN